MTNQFKLYIENKNKGNRIEVHSSNSIQSALQWLKDNQDSESLEDNITTILDSDYNGVFIIVGPDNKDIKVANIKEDKLEYLCPSCNKPIVGRPALSREDNKTNVCSTCGTLEALTTTVKDVNKKEAKKLKDIMTKLGHDIPLGHAYEVLARMNGFNSHNVAKAKSHDHAPKPNGSFIRDWFSKVDHEGLLARKAESLDEIHPYSEMDVLIFNDLLKVSTLRNIGNQSVLDISDFENQYYIIKSDNDIFLVDTQGYKYPRYIVKASGDLHKQLLIAIQQYYQDEKSMLTNKLR